MRWLLFSVCLVAFLALPVSAAPDAYSSWKKGIKAFDKREAQYWDEFDGRLRYVYEDWSSKWRLWRSDPDGFKDERVPLDGIRELYEEYVELQRAKSEIHKSFARSNHAKALATLFDELMDLSKDVDALEKELVEARPTGGRSTPRYEQAAPIRRHGAEVTRDGLLQAIALIPDASTFLVDAGLTEAVKGDKKKSIYRRTAVLDALGLIEDEPARAKLIDLLQAKEPFLRILATENLAARGPDLTTTLMPMLADPSPVVRRAFYDTLRVRARDVSVWIGILVGHLLQVEGVERVRLIAALESMSGVRLGNDPEAWSAWLEGAKTALAEGTYVRPGSDVDATEPGDESEEKDDAEEPDEADADAAPVAESDLPAVEGRVSFYGIQSPSAELVLLVDGSRFMNLPADLETQTLRADTWWRQTGPKWKEEHADHHSFLLQQLQWTLEALPEDARFGVIHLHGSTPKQIDVMGAKKLLRPSKGTVKSVLKNIRKARPEGQLSCQEGLAQALLMCGAADCRDPKDGEILTDTIYLVNPGANGGRYPLPEILLAWWNRANRFRRMTIHAIRICDEKEEAEHLMRGLAADSVGTYHWLTEL